MKERAELLAEGFTAKQGREPDGLEMWRLRRAAATETRTAKRKDAGLGPVLGSAADALHDPSNNQHSRSGQPPGNHDCYSATERLRFP